MGEACRYPGFPTVKIGIPDIKIGPIRIPGNYVTLPPTPTGPNGREPLGLAEAGITGLSLILKPYIAFLSFLEPLTSLSPNKLPNIAMELSGIANDIKATLENYVNAILIPVVTILNSVLDRHLTINATMRDVEVRAAKIRARIESGNEFAGDRAQYEELRCLCDILCNQGMNNLSHESNYVRLLAYVVGLVGSAAAIPAAFLQGVSGGLDFSVLSDIRIPTLNITTTCCNIPEIPPAPPKDLVINANLIFLAIGYEDIRGADTLALVRDSLLTRRTSGSEELDAEILNWSNGYWNTAEEIMAASEERNGQLLSFDPVTGEGVLDTGYKFLLGGKVHLAIVRPTTQLTVAFTPGVIYNHTIYLPDDDPPTRFTSLIKHVKALNNASVYVKIFGRVRERAKRKKKPAISETINKGLEDLSSDIAFSVRSRQQESRDVSARIQDTINTWLGNPQAVKDDSAGALSTDD